MLLGSFDLWCSTEQTCEDLLMTNNNFRTMVLAKLADIAEGWRWIDSGDGTMVPIQHKYDLESRHVARFLVTELTD